MRIERDKSLKDYNTFGIDVKARRFVSVKEIRELQRVLDEHRDQGVFILGGGSNLLLTRDIEKPVVHIGLRGIDVLSTSGNTVQVEAMAGENWHAFVEYCLENNFGGIENLALIPGNCGTAPVQNIGAYGVELKDRFVSCRAMEIATGELTEFNKTDCQFGYRDSIFKSKLKGKYVILSIRLELTLGEHQLNTSYGAIRDVLQHKGIADPGIRDVARAVVEIRRSKLPDPKQLGNSGSFFKNPVLKKNAFEQLVARYPGIPSYPLEDGRVKVPAGWLIEKAGFKGKRFGDAGVHEKQALVLVNYGQATGGQLAELAGRIQQAVREQFGIALDPEVNII